MNELERFQPKTAGPPPVEVELMEPIPTDPEIEKMLKEEMGMVCLGSTRLSLYRKLGVHQKGHGVIYTQSGRCFISQSRLDDNMRMLHELLTDRARPDPVNGFKNVNIDEVTKLSRELSVAAKALNDAQEFMLRVESPQPRNQPAPAAVNTFPAGAIVAGGNAQIHVHQTRPAGGEKPVANPCGPT